MTETAPRVPRELARLGPRELLVHETYASIQGESTFAGRPCFFIRLTGCHLRCVWCDTEHAFREGRRQTVDDCVEAARAAKLDLVEVTGGEPLLQRACLPLLEALCDADHTVLLETSGAVPLGRVDPRVRKIVDLKAPGSGEVERNVPGLVESLRPGDELKIVLADRADYEWARAVTSDARRGAPRLGSSIPIHFSPVFGRLKSAELAAWILEDRLPVRLGFQLHKHIWPEDARGV